MKTTNYRNEFYSIRNYNEPLSGPEKKLMELINGAEPENESERKLKADIKKIKEKGDVIDIPSM